MFFKRNCVVCQSKELMIRDLQDQLQQALSEIDKFKKANERLNGAMKNFSKPEEKADTDSLGIVDDAIRNSSIEEGPNISELRDPIKVTTENNTRKRQHPNKCKISQKDLRLAVNAISDRCKNKISIFVATSSSEFKSGEVSEEVIEKFNTILIEGASEIITSIGFSRSAEELGILLTQDERTWDYFSKSKLPNIVKAEEAKTAKKHQWDAFMEQLQISIEQHKPQLISNLRKSFVINEYGTVELDDRNKEIARYLSSVKLESKAYAVGYGKVYGYIKAWAKREMMKTSIDTPLPKNGIDFEYWVADRFNEKNWSAQVTQGSGDQGVDVVVNIGDLRVAVQCKLYTGSVGNKAVQEVLAGMSFFDLDRGVIISTGKNTKSAHALAKKNKILLLAPQDIPYLSELLQIA
jgi:hypothetical protein